eukprot:gene3749-biopygen12204
MGTNTHSRCGGEISSGRGRSIHLGSANANAPVPDASVNGTHNSTAHPHIYTEISAAVASGLEGAGECSKIWVGLCVRSISNDSHRE